MLNFGREELASRRDIDRRLAAAEGKVTRIFTDRVTLYAEPCESKLK